MILNTSNKNKLNFSGIELQVITINLLPITQQHLANIAREAELNCNR